jgi:hypothetical protein
MASAPSQPGVVSEREFSLIADGLFNGELDERAARLEGREREQQREFDLLADEVERMRLFNEELDQRAERMDQRARHLAHAMEMRAAELDTREEALWKEQETYSMERKLMTRANLELAGRWHDLLEREQLQRGREAELALWQSQLEGREDELATAQFQLSEEREAFERWARRARDEATGSSVSPPPEGDF